MHAEDVLKYGDKTFLETLAKFPNDKLEVPNACGVWSVKDIVAHLASHEQVLVEVLRGLTGADDKTPYMDEMAKGSEEFNVAEVEKRKSRSFDEVLSEYKDAHEKTIELLREIPEDKRRENDTLPWYGMQYDLEDFLVYGYYGHKREHSTHIAAFQDVLARGG